MGFINLLQQKKRHYCLFNILKKYYKEHTFDDGVQGFLTSDDRFVDRKEGGQIAFDAGQTAKLTECLFSEDLY